MKRMDLVIGVKNGKADVFGAIHTLNPVADLALEVVNVVIKGRNVPDGEFMRIANEDGELRVMGTAESTPYFEDFKDLISASAGIINHHIMAVHVADMLATKEVLGEKIPSSMAQ